MDSLAGALPLGLYKAIERVWDKSLETAVWGTRGSRACGHQALLLVEQPPFDLAVETLMRTQVLFQHVLRRGRDDLGPL